jgi:hypothetical protein|tara:strand:+ start:3846 stop:4076 length:231 start_codon:yes stop_codon:yes gene_type:complete
MTEKSELMVNVNCGSSDNPAVQFSTGLAAGAHLINLAMLMCCWNWPMPKWPSNDQISVRINDPTEGVPQKGKKWQK